MAGVAGFYELYLCILHWPSKSPEFPERRVHSGVLRHYRHIMPFVTEAVKAILESWPASCPGYRMVLSGHSLGAAAAQLMAETWRLQRPAKLLELRANLSAPFVAFFTQPDWPSARRVTADSSWFHISGFTHESDPVDQLTKFFGYEGLKIRMLSLTWSNELVLYEAGRPFWAAFPILPLVHAPGYGLAGLAAALSEPSPSPPRLLPALIRAGGMLPPPSESVFTVQQCEAGR